MDMDAVERLKILSSQMHLEPGEDAERGFQTDPKFTKKTDRIIIGHATLPGGRRIPLLKTLLTSACERDCYYCPFRAGRDFRRATFKPDEFAHTFMALHRGRLAEGVFLSSGITGGGVNTQDRLIAAAAILRNKLGYRGYLHLKIMPGAEKGQVERAMQLADRVSINLEAPNTHRLQLLAPNKQFIEELVQPLKWANEIRRTQPANKNWKGRWPSTVTQFVVGGVGESDVELLSTTETLHRQTNLNRAYYSSFCPVSDTPLENVPPGSALRQHRLYQSSFLLRDYGFSLEDLAFDITGNLPLTQDPKQAWAEANLRERPVELIKASRSELLKIPGIGPRSADAIMKARREGRLTRFDLAALKKVGANTNRAAPYILIGGRRPEFQLPLLVEV
jgi:predicted DNA-binding helix-hairpin-helix protein